jgi:hypothetical protein
MVAGAELANGGVEERDPMPDPVGEPVSEIPLVDRIGINPRFAPASKIGCLNFGRVAGEAGFDKAGGAKICSEGIAPTNEKSESRWKFKKSSNFIGKVSFGMRFIFSVGFCRNA